MRFHDGRELTAEDVAFTFRRFLDPAFVSGRKGAYRGLKSVDVIDATHVAFRLHQPAASFPINLVMGIVPEGTGAAAARAPVGSGPYQLGEFVPMTARHSGHSTGTTAANPRTPAWCCEWCPTKPCAGSNCAKAPWTWS